MADTITIGPNVIQIVPNAAGISNFDITTYFPNGIRCSGVEFVGSNGLDIFKMRSRTAGGTFLVPYLSGTLDSMGFLPPIDCFPFILATDLTLTTPANCIISIYYV